MGTEDDHVDGPRGTLEALALLRRLHEGAGQPLAPFWGGHLREIAGSTLLLLVASGGAATAEGLEAMAHSLPRTVDQARSKRWRRDAYSHRILRRAERRSRGWPADARREVRGARRYCFCTWPSMADPVRSAVLAEFHSLLNSEKGERGERNRP